MTNEPQRVYLKDYAPPPYSITAVKLRFELDPEHTVVTNEMTVTSAPSPHGSGPLVLNGEGLELLSVEVNHHELSASEYETSPVSLTLSSPPSGQFLLTIKTICAPVKNTALEGLYLSSGMFCTQNEPQGFRRITYFLDRSDVMAVYTTTIVADKTKFPILLANGNCIATRDLDRGLHEATWHDPFPKPSYLFALVAGDLGVIESSFMRRSGKPVTLRIYTDKGNEPRCRYAMECLKRAMKWDEDTFGLEYDLDIFMIVAVNDFNFGAMENKGLNIFSARCILADEETATDERLISVDAIIAHEYFHNWTGDRITCRDWFQLTLKEGLTVLREQLYTADVTEAHEKRIIDAADLERDQFPEDSGPLAHPIQPKSFVEINNFYTATVYDKGAEVIRMIRTMLGAETFRRGIDTYFSMFDGQAVTTDDFIVALERASERDFSAFRRWYHQSGTPEVAASWQYHQNDKSWTLTLTQSHPHGKFYSPEGVDTAPRPLVIPFAIGLLTPTGAALRLHVQGSTTAFSEDRTTALLLLTEETQSFTLSDIPVAPIPSLLRGFSAPVRVTSRHSLEETALLFASDPDPYARWRAGQDLYRSAINELLIQTQKRKPLAVAPAVTKAFTHLLASDLPPGLLALMMEIPAESTFTDCQTPPDFEGTHAARNALMKIFADDARPALLALYHRAYQRGVGSDYAAISYRRLARETLTILMASDDLSIAELCADYQKNARNMTEEFGGLVLLADSSSVRKEAALARFYKRWNNDPVVICSWFTAQAQSTQPDTLARCRTLEKDPAFVVSNPSKAMALYRTFANNEVCFNAADGSGYRFIADAIRRLDSINPNTAALLAKRFVHVQQLPPALKHKATEVLHEIEALPRLSVNTREVVQAALATRGT